MIHDMDVTQALRDAENALRDFIAITLMRKLGEEWIDSCGVSSERIDRWRARKVEEERHQEAGVVEERLIYYADFYDLKKILKKHWGSGFSDAFGDWKTMEVYLTELEKLRNSDAHRRELLPHQKHLVLGIAGEIRNRLVRYRSKMETTDDCFPRIESVRDSIGNIWVPGGILTRYVRTKNVLRPGDTLEFVVTASDPEDLPLYYGIKTSLSSIEWQDLNAFQITLTEKDIRQDFKISLYIKSGRQYHAHSDRDDYVSFFYDVLPKK